MEWAFIIVVLLYAVAVVFAFKLVKSIAKALLLVGAVGLVLVALLSLFVYKDVVDLRDNWPNSQKLLLVEKDGVFLAGMVSSLSNAGDMPEFVTSEQLVSLQSGFEGKDFKSMLGDNYKLFVLDFDSVLAGVSAENFNVPGFDVNFSKVDLVGVLVSDAPSKTVEELLVGKGYDYAFRNQAMNRLGQDIGDDSKIKGAFFSLLVAQLFSEKGSQAGLFVLKEFKSGNLVIYPDTVVFKVVKFVPGFVIDMAGDIVSNKKGVGSDGNS